MCSHPSIARTCASSRICFSFCVMALSLYLHVRVRVGGDKDSRGQRGRGLLSGSVCDGAASRRAATTPSPPDNHFRGASARVEDSLHKRLALLDALLVGPAGPGARGQHHPAIAQHAGGRVTRSKPRTHPSMSTCIGSSSSGPSGLPSCREHPSLIAPLPRITTLQPDSRSIFFCALPRGPMMAPKKL